MAAVRLNLSPVATCPRQKHRYYDKFEAEMAVFLMKYRGTHRPEQGELRVYHCTICDALHVGHGND